MQIAQLNSRLDKLDRKVKNGNGQGKRKLKLEPKHHQEAARQRKRATGKPSQGSAPSGDESSVYRAALVQPSVVYQEPGIAVPDGNRTSKLSTRYSWQMRTPTAADNTGQILIRPAFCSDVDSVQWTTETYVNTLVGTVTSPTLATTSQWLSHAFQVPLTKSAWRAKDSLGNSYLSRMRLVSLELSLKYADRADKKHGSIYTYQGDHWVNLTNRTYDDLMVEGAPTRWVRYQLANNDDSDSIRLILAPKSDRDLRLVDAGMVGHGSWVTQEDEFNNDPLVSGDLNEGFTQITASNGPDGCGPVIAAVRIECLESILLDCEVVAHWEYQTQGIGTGMSQNPYNPEVMRDAHKHAQMVHDLHKHSPKMSPATIAGITLGTVAGASVLAGGAYFLSQEKNRKKITGLFKSLKL